ncbi:MAG: (deoxy)nucleoside triphosphate pyrophosphohydrolase [Alphaproteobacteria bacterium]|nr:(deoxy)nucleoside triphosphate pyrophosphohydrolase [Alphaproteobacteria bacterium]
MTERKLITVTAGIIYYQDKILIAQRRKDKSLGGLWEFPGGKIEAGETCEQTLAREIKEEFDIQIDVSDYLMEHTFAYPDFDLKMYVYKASWNGLGEIKICDHEQYAFVSIEEMKNYEFAGADIPVIEFLKQA